jgi:phosphoenolpyruvate carboxylase
MITQTLFNTARARWPQQWRSLRPMPMRFASWVGYDMDGRTDIGWNTCIRYRLRKRPSAWRPMPPMLAEAAPDIATRLLAGAERAEEMAALFGAT